MSLTDEFKVYAQDRGLDLIGFTSPRPFQVKEDWMQADPRAILPSAHAVVVAACYLYGTDTTEPSAPGRPRGRFGPWTKASFAAVRWMNGVVQGFLEKRGFQAVATSDLPLKRVAVRSGIVQYGKNSIVHADGLGSYLKLSAVVTDAELDCTDGPLEVSDCGDCNACLEACPTGAIAEPFRLTPNRCICSWLWGDPIAREDRHKVGNLIHRCDFCQVACPKNQGLTPRPDLPFELKPTSDCPELIPLLQGDERSHKSVLPEITLEAGTDTIRRNAAIALGNSGDRAAIPALAEALSSTHQPTRVAAAWALGQLGGPEAQEALTRVLDQEQEEEVLAEIRASLAVCQ